MMRVDSMDLTVCCGLASSLYVTATAFGQLAFTAIPASLPIPTPAFIALLSLCLFGLAAAQRRVWDNGVAAPWSAWSVTAASAMNEYGASPRGQERPAMTVVS